MPQHIYTKSHTHTFKTINHSGYTVYKKLAERINKSMGHHTVARTAKPRVQ